MVSLAIFRSIVIILHIVVLFQWFSLSYGFANGSSFILVTYLGESDYCICTWSIHFFYISSIWLCYRQKYSSFFLYLTALLILILIFFDLVLLFSNRLCHVQFFVLVSADSLRSIYSSVKT